MNEPRQIKFGQYRLDEANECLWHEGAAIALRPKAYAVLRYLMAHAGVLVTKQQLLDGVWPDTFVSDAVLKDSISQLREALCDDPKSPKYIETSHRRGYRFIADTVEPGGQSDSRTTKPLDLTTMLANRDVEASFESLSIPGRKVPLLHLHSLFEKALGGDAQFVFVTGEAGIGKTTVVEAFLGQVSARDGVFIARGQCLEQYGASEAFLPVLDGLSRIGEGRDGENIAELFKRHAPSWLAQMPGLRANIKTEGFSEEGRSVTRERMLREMAEVAEALTARAPLILILEDLHWGDYSTLDLVSYLAHRRSPARLMLIGTYRPVEVILSEHPLKGVKQELLMHKLCHELPLEYLKETDIAEYLETKFPSHQFSTQLAPKIHQHTEGNPLFMVNVVEYLVNEQIIKEEQGCWSVKVQLEEVELGVPENIRNLIEMHIDRLSSEEQRVLEGASIVGMDCSAVAIGAGLNEDVVRIEEVCDALARHQHFLLPAYLAELPDGTITPRYRFIHALYLDVLYKRVSSTRRSQIHGRIAERGERIYGERVSEIAAELAVHFEQARDSVRAVKYFHLAAENAARRSAYREAASLAQHSIKLLKGMPDTPERVTRELDIQEWIARTCTEEA